MEFDLSVYERAVRFIKKNPHNIRYLINPNQDLYRLAISLNPYTIFWVDSPDMELQMLAIQANVKTLKNIDNPCKEVLFFLEITR